MILHPTHFSDYELLDCGDFQKLERFGKLILSRPEPQAVWPTSLSHQEWERKAQAVFKKDSRLKDTDEKGTWMIKDKTPEQWMVRAKLKQGSFSMRLGMTSFKHVGIFPEQYANWEFIADSVAQLYSASGTPPKVLNLFAYTGGASLAARTAGAEVTHLDAVKQVLSWAKENSDLSHLDGFRWILDDALKYVQREVRRGNKYSGIVLDPPAYGRGPDGEKWILNEGIAALMDACSKLLLPQGFVILNLYSMGFSPTLADTLMGAYFPKSKGYRQSGELAVVDHFGKILPLSIFSRFFLK